MRSYLIGLIYLVTSLLLYGLSLGLVKSEWSKLLHSITH